ncbi:MAG: MerR family transcriptional regulator [Clostridia bacterium]|nr:MerR family transcriptional regulator [Clostridia bacterium]
MGTVKYILRIGEFAKLKNVTTEALRHYDRVGLLRPIEVDEETGYRYYSVFQSERLATIIELKALGFSLEEMKSFLANRYLQHTYDVLEEKHSVLLEKIEEMQRVEKSLSKKLERLSDMMALDDSDRYMVRREPNCEIAYMEQIVENHVSFEWLASDLENQLVNIHPVVGSDAYGILMSKEAFFKGKLLEKTNLIYFIDDASEVDPNLLRVLPERQVACFMVRGPRTYFENHIANMIQMLREDGYEVVGDVVVRFRITTTSTDVAHEQLYEFQIPIL